MHTSNLIKEYKTPFTPMQEHSAMLRLYVNRSVQTGTNEFTSSFIIPKTFSHRSSLPTLNHVIAENRNRKFIKIYSDFTKKWESKGNYFQDFSKSFVFEKIKEVIDLFLSLSPEYITFSLTEDQSVFFKMNINQFNVYFELYFTNDFKEGVEAISNIYKNGEVIFAFGGQIETVFSKIESKVSKKHWFIQPSTSIYEFELSPSSFATATF